MAEPQPSDPHGPANLAEQLQALGEVEDRLFRAFEVQRTLLATASDSPPRRAAFARRESKLDEILPAAAAVTNRFGLQVDDPLEVDAHSFFVNDGGIIHRFQLNYQVEGKFVVTSRLAIEYTPRQDARICAELRASGDDPEASFPRYLVPYAELFKS